MFVVLELCFDFVDTGGGREAVILRVFVSASLRQCAGAKKTRGILVSGTNKAVREGGGCLFWFVLVGEIFVLDGF